jgi:hypothetical protein
VIGILDDGPGECCQFCGEWTPQSGLIVLSAALARDPSQSVRVFVCPPCIKEVKDLLGRRIAALSPAPAPAPASAVPNGEMGERRCATCSAPLPWPHAAVLSIHLECGEDLVRMTIPEVDTVIRESAVATDFDRRLCPDCFRQFRSWYCQAHDEAHARG